MQLLHINGFFVVPRGQKGGFVQKVRQIRTGKACRCLRNDLQVDFLCQRLAFGMYAEDCLAPFYVRTSHIHLPVETARAQKRRVKNIRAVRCRNDDNAFVNAETVHFHKQLVQRLFTLIMPAAKARAAASAHSVNLVYKYDARRIFLCLFKQIAHAGRAHAYEHFHKV